MTDNRTLISRFPHLKEDFAASLVVFLVAVPLCVGVSVASGAPAELGLVTGIVGGLVTGGCAAAASRCRDRPPA